MPAYLLMPLFCTIIKNILSSRPGMDGHRGVRTQIPAETLQITWKRGGAKIVDCYEPIGDNLGGRG